MTFLIAACIMLTALLLQKGGFAGMEDQQERNHEKRSPTRRQKLLMLLIPSLVLLISLSVIASHLVGMSRAAHLPGASAPAAVQEEAAEAPPEAETAAPETTAEPTAAPAVTPEPTPAPTPEAENEPSPFGWQEFGGSLYYLRPDGSAVTGLHMIEGKLCYFDGNGVKSKALGVDVSFYNKGINWHLAKAQGLDFAIVRAGYRGWETGLLHEDSCFRQNLRGAKEAGLSVGVYFFSTATCVAEAAEEAAYVLELLNGFPLDLPVFLDIEDSGDYPAGRADKLSAVRRYEVVESFCRTIEDGGYHAGVYSYQNFVKFNKLDHSIAAPHIFWFASYTRYNKAPDFPWSYDLWQFTDRGSVSGIRGQVDLNAVF